MASGGACDPWSDYVTGNDVSCKEFGSTWKVVGAFHSHPQNSKFSRGDDGRYIELGFGLGKGTPDGAVELLTEGGQLRILRPPNIVPPPQL